MKQKWQKFSLFHIWKDRKVFDFSNIVRWVLWLLVLSILIVPDVRWQESATPSSIELDNNVSTVYNMYLVDSVTTQNQVGRIFIAWNNFQILWRPIIIWNYVNNSIITNNLLWDNQYSNVLWWDNMKVYSDNITIIWGEENSIGVWYNNTVVLGWKQNIIWENIEGSNYIESAVMVWWEGNIIESNQKWVIVVWWINNMISENVENSQILWWKQNEVSVSNAIVAWYDVKNSEARDSFAFSDGKEWEFSPETSNAFYINTEKGLWLNTGSVNKWISSEWAISLWDLQNTRCRKDVLWEQWILNWCLVRCTDYSLENGWKWELLDKSEDCLDKTKNGENPNVLVKWQCGLARYGCVRWISVNNENTEDAYRWKCSWLNGWSTASCSEEKPKPVNWECGDNLNVCRSWKLEEVSSTRWNCKWENGWSSISCSVSNPGPVVYWDCGENPVHYVCKEWTPKNLDENEFEYTWTCEWHYNDSCRETKLLAGKCEWDVNVANATICGDPEKYEGATFQIELIDVNEQCSSTAENQCIYKCNSGYHKVDWACHKDCTFDWKTIKHWESDVWYKSNFVECSSEDSVCEGELLTCEDWRLYYEDESGNKVNGEEIYQFSSCTLEGHDFSPEERASYPIEEDRFLDKDNPNYIDEEHRSRWIYSEVYSYDVEWWNTCKVSGTRYALVWCEKGKDDEGNDIEIDFYEERNDQCIEKCSYNGSHDVGNSSSIKLWYKSDSANCSEDGQRMCDHIGKQCRDGVWLWNEEYSSSTCILEDRNFTPEEKSEYPLEKCDENGTCEYIYSYSFSNNSCSISGTRYKLISCNVGYTKWENVCYADCKYWKDGQWKDIYVKHGEEREWYQSSIENCGSLWQEKCSLKVDAQCSDGKWLVGDEEKNSIYWQVTCRLNNVSFTQEEELEYPLDECDENGTCEYIYSYSFSNDSCNISDTRYKLTSCDDGYSPDATNKQCMLNCDYQWIKDVKHGTVKNWYKSASETCSTNWQESCTFVRKWCYNGSWWTKDTDYDKSSCSLTERNCRNEWFTVSSNDLIPHMLYDNCTNITLNGNKCLLWSTTLYKENACEEWYEDDGNWWCVPSNKPVAAKCGEMHNDCETWTFKFGSDSSNGNQYTWQCEWINWWNTAYCVENKIDGVCLVASKGCAKWDRQNYKEHKDGGVITYYEWECKSPNGWQTVSCSKSWTKKVSCWDAPSNSTWVNGEYVQTWNINTSKWEWSANPTCSSDSLVDCSFKCNEKTDTIQYSCNSSKTACEQKSLPKCLNLPDGAIANNDKRPENDTSYTYNEDDNIACTYSSCATNYTLNEKTKKCDADTSIVSCTDLPSNAIWVNDKFTKTRDGGSWIPTYVSPKFSLSESVECSYKCMEDYGWNSANKKCEPKTQLVDCNINTQPDHTVVTKWRFTQTYDPVTQSYLPASVAWTYDGSECGFVCDTDNHYSYDSGSQKCEVATETVACDNTDVPKKGNSGEYEDHVAIQNSTVVVSWDSDANDWSDPAACIWYCEKDSETWKEYAKKDDETGCEEVDRTMSCGNKPLNSKWKDGLWTYGQKKIWRNKYTPVISVSHYDKESTTDERCTWMCEAGYMYNKEGNVETCKSCPAWSYCPWKDGWDWAIDCENKNDLPSNAQFKTNQTSPVCDWECASGYTQEWNECKQDCSSTVCNVKHGETCTTYEENSVICPNKPNSKTLRCNNWEWGKWEEWNWGKIWVKDNNGPYSYKTYSQENKKCEASEYPLTSKSVENASFVDCISYTASDQSCTAWTTIYKFICERWYYSKENEIGCAKCEIWNYCPWDNVQHKCGNAPENAEYTTIGETGENCTWNCKPWFYKSQDKNNNIICSPCEVWNYCPWDNVQHKCENAPAENAEYTTIGETGENCTWDCTWSYTRAWDLCKANCSSKACESKHGESCTTYEKSSVWCISTTTECQSKTLKCNDGKWVHEDWSEDTPYDNQNCSLDIKTCSDTNYPLTDASGVDEANTYTACISYSINDNNQCTNNGIKYAVGVCNKWWYKSSPNSCSICEIWNYCPWSNAVVPCENKPQDNSHYINQWEKTENCGWDCDENYYESNNKCEACPDGYTSGAWSTDISQCCMTVNNKQYVWKKWEKPSDCGVWTYKSKHEVCANNISTCEICTNRPETNSRYISNGTNNDCEWRCNPWYYRSTMDKNGKIIDICSPCEEWYYCPWTDDDDSKHGCECWYKCPAKSAQEIACGNKMWSSVQSVSCNNINIWWYGISACRPEPDNQQCSNGPEHIEYISNGTNNDCAWQCEAGFYKNKNWNRCLECPAWSYCPAGTTYDKIPSCGGDLTSGRWSKKHEDCSVKCKEGTFLPAWWDKCEICLNDNYCVGWVTFNYNEGYDQWLTACPVANDWNKRIQMKSDAGSKTISDCYQSCDEHTYLPKNSAKCEVCPAWSYCPGYKFYWKSEDQWIMPCPGWYYCPEGQGKKTCNPNSGDAKWSEEWSDEASDCTDICYLDGNYWKCRFAGVVGENIVTWTRNYDYKCNIGGNKFSCKGDCKYGEIRDGMICFAYSNVCGKEVNDCAAWNVAKVQQDDTAWYTRNCQNINKENLNESICYVCKNWYHLEGNECVSSADRTADCQWTRPTKSIIKQGHWTFIQTWDEEWGLWSSASWAYGASVCGYTCEVWYYRNNCTACTGLPSNAKWTNSVAGLTEGAYKTVREDCTWICEAGYYHAKDNQQCKSCKSVSPTQWNTLTSHDWAYRKQECYTTCAAWTYLKKSWTSCSTCPAWSYCEWGDFYYNTNGDKWIKSCPTWYTSRAWAKTVNDCTDNTAPKITRTAKSNNATYDWKWQWTNSNIYVVVSYSDNGEIDTSTLQWRDNKNNTSWENVNNPWASSYNSTWSAEWDRTWYYKICDKAGNCSTTSLQVRIDKTSPTITRTAKSNGKAYTEWMWTTWTIYVDLSFSDGGSWIKADSLARSDDDTTWYSMNNYNTSSYKDSKWEAAWDRTWYYEICDNVGNCSIISLPILIDKTDPTASITTSSVDATTRRVTISCNDTLWWVKEYYFWTKAEPENSDFLSANAGSVSRQYQRWEWTYYLFCVDFAGNVWKASKKLDGSGPSCTWWNPSKTIVRAKKAGESDDSARSYIQWTITLTCTDAWGVSTSSLGASDFNMSNSGLLSIESVEAWWTSTSRTFKLTYKWVPLANWESSNFWNVKFTLPEGKVKDAAWNKNAAVTSSEIIVDNTSPTFNNYSGWEYLDDENSLKSLYGKRKVDDGNWNTHEVREEWRYFNVYGNKYYVKPGDSLYFKITHADNYKVGSQYIRLVNSDVDMRTQTTQNVGKVWRFISTLNDINVDNPTVTVSETSPSSLMTWLYDGKAQVKVSAECVDSDGDCIWDTDETYKWQIKVDDNAKSAQYEIETFTYDAAANQVWYSYLYSGSYKTAFMVIDNTPPVLSELANVTSTLKQNYQNFTIICNDDNIVPYYFTWSNAPSVGSNYSKRPRNTRGSKLEKEQWLNVDNIRKWNESKQDYDWYNTWYVRCKDIAGNISEEMETIIYYTYEVHNMVDGEEKSSYVYMAPKWTTITFEDIYTVPEWSSKSNYKWWSTTNSQDNIQTSASENLNGNKTYYIWFRWAHMCEWAFTLPENGNYEVLKNPKTGNNVCAYYCDPWYKIKCEGYDYYNSEWDDNISWNYYNNGSFWISSVAIFVEWYNSHLYTYTTSMYCRKPLSQWCEKCSWWTYSKWFLHHCDECWENTYSKPWASGCTACPEGTESGKWYSWCYGSSMWNGINLTSNWWSVSVICTNPWGGVADIQLYCGIEWETVVETAANTKLNRLCTYQPNTDTSPKEYTAYCIVKDPKSDKTYRSTQKVVVAKYVESEYENDSFDGSADGSIWWWTPTPPTPMCDPDFCPNWDYSWNSCDKVCCYDPTQDPAMMITEIAEEIGEENICGNYSTISTSSWLSQFSQVEITWAATSVCWVYAFNDVCKGAYTCYFNGYSGIYQNKDDDYDCEGWWCGITLDEVTVSADAPDFPYCWAKVQWYNMWTSWSILLEDSDNANISLSKECCCVLWYPYNWSTCMAVK